MRRHADQLLARSFEDDLNDAERAWLAAHLVSCGACRDLQRELTLAEERLERREVASDLPAQPELRPSVASGGWRRSAFVLAGATTAIVVALGIATLRGQTPAASDAPATGMPIAPSPGVVFARSVVLDMVPGGGAITTQAFDAFTVITPGGPTRTHAVGGVAVGTPLFDGRSRVAYWRRASIARPGGEVSGAWELLVWEIKTDRERVLLSLGDERPSGGLLWSVDSRSLVVPVRTAPGSTDRVRNRLLLIDADSAAVRVLNVSEGDVGIAPIVADAQTIVGVRGSSYVVLDATTGTTRAQTPLRVRGSFMGESADYASNTDGTVLELLRRFESDAGPLWIWDVRDPARDIAKVDGRGISDPIFWPGRTEVVFTRSDGLAVLDYRSGRTRPLTAPSGVRSVVAVESSGRFALVENGAKLEIVERVDDELKARPELQLVVGPMLSPLGIIFR